MKSRSSRRSRRILTKRWQLVFSSLKLFQIRGTWCSKSLKKSEMLFKMWPDLWRSRRGMRTNRLRWLAGFQKYPRASKDTSHNHPTARGTCTRVGEILLATYSTWCTWEGRKGWLYWWKIQSVPTWNLRGGRSNSGVSEQAWIPLSLFVKLLGVWAISTLNKCWIFV